EAGAGKSMHGHMQGRPPAHSRRRLGVRSCVGEPGRIRKPGRFGRARRRVQALRRAGEEALTGAKETDTPAEQKPLAAIALRLLTALLLAIMFALVKLASTRGVNVVESLFYRQCGSALAATAYVTVGPGFDSLRSKRVWAHVGRMALGVAAMGTNFLAFILLPLAEATTIGFSVPIFAVILAALLLGEPTGKWRWSAVAAGFVGVLIIVQPGRGSVPLLGASVALAAALLTASVTIVIRRLGATERAATTV